MSRSPFSKKPTAAEAIAYCMGKPGAVESHPWEDGTFVPKVAGKMFSSIHDDPAVVWAKVGGSVEESEPWRARYPDAVVVAAYIGKHGWVSVALDGTVDRDDLQEMLDQSYDNVVAKLPRSRRPT